MGTWAKDEGALHFVANKGQWPEQVAYKSELQDGAVFLMPGGFRYSFYDVSGIQHIHDNPHDENFLLKAHAYDVLFVNSSAGVLEGEDKRSYYHNYFIGKDSTRWTANVPVYSGVLYSELYPGISTKVYSTGTFMKYDLLVAPGADVRDIQMQFNGVEPYIDEQGDLVIHTSVNTVVEQAPYAYQVIDGVETMVPCRYVMKGGKLSFDFPEGYDKTRQLVIDPVLKFATYTGSTGQLWGYCSAFDSAGNFYSGSAAFNTGFPVTTGAYQTVYSGNDIAINKYNATGNSLLYATYCGGSAGTDYPLAMVVNNNNELVICGHTYSNNYPVTPGAIDPTYNGAGDMVVTVLNASGTALTGSTYLGGNNVEGIAAYAFHDNDENKVGLCTNNQGDIYIAASTQSKDLPVTPGAFQAVHNSTFDGCIFRINRSCSSILYGTYFGGDHIDCIYDCRLSGNNLVICGRTISSNFPLGVNAYSNTGNAFVSILSGNGQFLIASTKLGLHTESAMKVSLDDHGNVFVCGNNDTAFVPSPGTYSENKGKVFIAKLNPGLNSMIRCTKLVGQEFPGVTGFTNICGDVVGSVLLKQISALPVTPNAYQLAPSAYYFFHLGPGMDSLVYATFYGVPNDPVKGGHAHSWSAIDTNGVIWLSTCNKDSKSSLPGTAGSFCAASISGVHNYDHLSAKFDLEVLPAKPVAKFILPDTVCAKTNIVFANQSSNAYSHSWYFGDGDSSNLRYPVHRYNTPGYYTVKLKAYNPYSCRVADSIEKVIFVDTNEIHANYVAIDTTCPGRTVNFFNTSKSGVSYLWDYGDGATATTYHGQHVYNTPGVYFTKLVAYNADFCNKTDTATHIIVVDNTNPGAAFSISQPMSCADKPVQFTNETKRGVTYAWDFGDGSTASSLGPVHVYKSGGKRSVRLIATNNILCVPHDTAWGEIEILPPLQIDLVDSFICGGKEPVTWGIRLLHVNSYATYRWEPANAVISGGNEPMATVDPRIATKYFVTVTDSIPGWCSHVRTDTATLSIIDYPEGVQVVSNSPVCEGDTLRLQGSTASSMPMLAYKWTGPDGFSASGKNTSRVLNRQQGGRYILGVDNNGCTTYAEANVIVKPKPIIDAGSNSPVWAGRELKLSIKADMEPDTFWWTGPNGFFSAEQSPVINPAKPEHSGSYTLTAIRDGCMSGDITIVTVNEVDSQYLRLYPNPNDGVFIIEGKGFMEQQIKILVLNSLGQKLYRADVNTEKKHFRHQVVLPAVSGGVYIIKVLIDGEYKSLPFTILRR